VSKRIPTIAAIGARPDRYFLNNMLPLRYRQPGPLSHARAGLSLVIKRTFPFVM